MQSFFKTVWEFKSRLFTLFGAKPLDGMERQQSQGCKHKAEIARVWLQGWNNAPQQNHLFCVNHWQTQLLDKSVHKEMLNEDAGRKHQYPVFCFCISSASQQNTPKWLENKRKRKGQKPICDPHNQHTLYYRVVEYILFLWLCSE